MTIKAKLDGTTAEQMRETFTMGTQTCSTCGRRNCSCGRVPPMTDADVIRQS